MTTSLYWIRALWVRAGCIHGFLVVDEDETISLVIIWMVKSTALSVTSHIITILLNWPFLRSPWGLLPEVSRGRVLVRMPRKWRCSGLSRGPFGTGCCPWPLCSGSKPVEAHTPPYPGMRRGKQNDLLSVLDPADMLDNVMIASISH